MSILPLPGPLGLDQSRIIHQPVRLHIKPGNMQTHTQITDDFGREIVCWEKQSFSFSKRRVFHTPEGLLLWTLRAHGSSVLQGCMIGGAKGWYIEGADGRELGWFEPDGTNKASDYDIGFVNTAGGGETFQLRLRGSLSDSNAALMLGNMPVVLFRRQMVHSYWMYATYTSPAATYEATVAPGSDLLWIASLISALEVVLLDRR